MILKSENVILRDMLKEDIDNRIKWETVDTEWQQWDAPWENEPGFNEKEYREDKLEEIAEDIDDEDIRYSFEICINNAQETHIGWCSAYHIDKEYNYTKDYGEMAIGIDIPEIKYRKKGYGTEAWVLYIDYLIDSGVDNIYTQTWSGNSVILKLIKKLGFVECEKKFMDREVRGALYDSLTFKLDLDNYRNIRHEILISSWSGK